MFFRIAIRSAAAVVLIGASTVTAAHADELLFSYDGDVFPWDGGWSGDEGRCDGPCVESIEDGHFVLRYNGGGDRAVYSHTVAPFEMPPPPPPTL